MAASWRSEVKASKIKDGEQASAVAGSAELCQVCIFMASVLQFL